MEAELSGEANLGIYEQEQESVVVFLPFHPNSLLCMYLQTARITAKTELNLFLQVFLLMEGALQTWNAARGQ